MKRFPTTLSIIGAVLVIVCSHVLAWNIPGHMLSGAIAYHTLQRESPKTIATVRSILDKNPWYETRWKAQLEKLPEAERDETRNKPTRHEDYQFS